jgi:DNA polymerase-3 subunit alpha
MKFTHLHNHSHYSLLDGLPKIDDMIRRTKEFDLDALALTDHGTMYGIIEFYQKCKRAEIKPILGVEAYVARNRHTDKRPKIDDKPYHLLLLAYNYEGYQNLMRLTSIAHLKGYYYKPRVDKDLLRQYGKGLIAATACLGGEIQKSILNDNDLEKTALKIKEYQDIFGKENFYLEIQHHPEIPEQLKVNAAMFELSKNLNIPIIATCDSHYLDRDDQEAQDVMLCVQTGKTVNDEKRLNMKDFWAYMKSPDEMKEDFKGNHEILENTQEIADRCNVEIPLYNKYFPVFKVETGKTADEELRDLAFKHLKEKFGITPQPRSAGQVRPLLDKGGKGSLPDNSAEADFTAEQKERLERIEHELDIIKSKGYSTYFLIVADFVNWMREKGVVTTTRGSAAGCFVSYLIGITNIDPIEYKIPFERFLNPFRPSLPDIDVDIADNRRDEVIDYVRRKYGEDKVAQICTFGTMAARGSVKDAGRALDLPYAFCDELSKMIPMGKQGFLMTIKRALDETPELKERYDKDPQVKKLFDLAQKIEGCARHASVHAAGVVISPTALTDYTPLQLDKDGLVITQYDMYSVGEDGVGLVKLDFLGIRNLSILGEAIKYIKAIHNVDIDLDSLPLDDEKTFKLLSQGRTMGVFQLSSEGMTQNLVALKPTTIHDIMAMVALYRPGPMESIPEYIKRKHNPDLINYPHEKLKKYLEKSLGLLVYQDDVLYTAIELAGYNWEEADKFRKAMGKKIPKLMFEQEEKFISGCVKNGIPHGQAVEIFELIKPFAAYGFNKAHAASYGMVAYQTAYLKAHYPAAYMAALMTAESNDLDKVADAINECEDMGIEVTLPDINESFSDFTVVKESLNTERPRIRFGLVAVKNIGQNIVKSIIAERKENGKFVNLADFLYRVKSKDLNKKSVESLIKSGALDSFGRRDQMLGNIDRLLNYIKETHQQGANGQVSLFATMQANSTPDLVLDEVPQVDKKQLLLWEKELLGLYVSEHPFGEYSKYVKDLIIPCDKLNNYKHASNNICIAGLVSSVKKIMTKNNDPMLFVKLEDDVGDVEVIVFPKLYQKNSTIWREDAPLIIQGKVSDRDAEVKLLANKVFELELDKIDEIKKALSKTNGNGNNNHQVRDLSKFGLANKATPPPPQRGGETVISPPFQEPVPNGVREGVGGGSTSKLIISLPNLDDIELQKKLKNLLTSHSGTGKVILQIGQEPNIKKIETGFLVGINDDLKQEIERLVGEESVELI